MSDKNGAVVAAKRRANRKEDSGIKTLSTGVLARFVPVAISIITEAQSAVKDPPVPVWHNPDKGRDEPNPDHPDYGPALQRAEERRGVAAVDAMIMFGVELEEGLPEDTKWLKKLQLRSRMGLSDLDMSEFDLDDEIDLEFLYKKYIAVTTSDLKPLMDMSGFEGEVASATKSFPDN